MKMEEEKLEAQMEYAKYEHKMDFGLSAATGGVAGQCDRVDFIIMIS